MSIRYNIISCIALLFYLVACSSESEQITNKSALKDRASTAPITSNIQPTEDSISDTLTASTEPSNKHNTIFNEYEFSTAAEAANIKTINDIQKEPFCLKPQVQTQESQKIIADACIKISNRLASVTYELCESANLRTTQCESVNKFPILYSEFSPVVGKHPQARILVIGGTHGDELTSVSIVFKWIEMLNKHHSGLFHWHIAPLMNPDGVLKSEATRTNSNGIDLNRNLPSSDWYENAMKYWQEKTDKNPRRYPGQKPLSEPETQWLVDELNRFKPDAIISVHAPYGIIDFDSQALHSAPKNIGRLRLNLLGTYPGSLGNYAGINRDIPVITLELPHAWVMPSNSEITKIWEDTVAWLRKNIN